MHLRATLYTPSTESNYLSFNQTRGCRTHSEALQNSEIETRVSEAKQPKNPTTSFCFPRRHSSKAALIVPIPSYSPYSTCHPNGLGPADRCGIKSRILLTFVHSVNPALWQSAALPDPRSFFPFFLHPSFLLLFLFSLLPSYIYIFFSFGSGEKSFLRKIYRYFLLCFGIGCLRVSVRHVARTVLFVFEQDLVLLSFVFTLGNGEKFHACLLLMFRLQYAGEREKPLFFCLLSLEA